MYCLFFVYEK
jgi:hypothetical protein